MRHFLVLRKHHRTLRPYIKVTETETNNRHLDSIWTFDTILGDNVTGDNLFFTSKPGQQRHKMVDITTRRQSPERQPLLGGSRQSPEDAGHCKNDEVQDYIFNFLIGALTA